MYKYRAKVTRVIDGDTAVVLVDLGFYVFITVHLRLFGINAPEMHGETRLAGAASKARLQELIEGKDILIESRALDKYGRTVAVVFLNDVSINDQMVKEGLAVPYLPSARIISLPKEE
jgi:micrococcal nuclease